MAHTEFIRINKKDKQILNKLKKHPRETYGDIIDRLLKEKLK